MRHVVPPTLSRRAVVAAGLASLWALPTFAQDYPTKPIRLIVGYASGGGVDYTARVIAPRLADALNVPVVIDNRAGASGVIGSDHVAKSAPDGYTLVFAPASAMVTTPQATARPPYNTLTDFAPVNLVGQSPLLIAVHPSLGVRSLKELIKLSQTRSISFASAGAGGMTHFVIEMLNQASNGNIVHVAYKGGAPAIVDAVAGHVQGVVADFPPLLPMFKDQRLIPLAVTSEARAEFLPDVPAANEDVPGFVAQSWYGIFAPAKTPRVVIDKLNAALGTVLSREDVRDQMRKGAVVPATTASPAAFQKFVADDYARWGKLVRDRNLVNAN